MEPPDRYAAILRIVVVLTGLEIGMYITLSPGVVYAPVPSVVLFLLISLLPAVLFRADGTLQKNVFGAAD